MERMEYVIFLKNGLIATDGRDLSVQLPIATSLALPAKP
jgi:hypothetical protein